MRLLVVLLAMLSAAPATASPGQCAPEKQIYLTIDTGSMRDAEHIAAVMNRHAVKATFFLANESTVKGDRSLEDGWASYWKERLAEGHAFGTHTWRHWWFREDKPDGTVRYQGLGRGEVEFLDKNGFCAELNRSADRFHAITGTKMSPLWRAPGGRTTPRVLGWAKDCGFGEHVGWSPAGFLGDELPSDKFPNEKLLARALATVRAGDILVMHTGIWSRKQNFTEIFEPLITGLKDKGFCFATLNDRPAGGRSAEAKR